MFEMTEQELTLYGEKKRVLKEFAELFFKDVGSTFSKPLGTNIYDKFTLKEVISDDFLHSFYPYLVQKYTYNHLYGIFNRFQSKGEFKNLTKEESEALLPIVIDCFSGPGEAPSFPTAVSIFKAVMNKNISEEDLVSMLFERDYFKKSRTNVRSDYVLSFIDNIVGKGSFDDAEKLINTIQSNFPDYHNFPIIIMNKNISKEEKIKALKLIYRKKDFPQYKLYFRKNLTDLNDLDTFIEATIIQNNRVREKEDNLIKLFKDIFISGEWRENLFKDKHYDHLQEFSEKYSKYFFNSNFARKFYNDNVGSLQTNESAREDQYQSFIKAIFSGVSVDKKIEALTNSKELECLGENFPSDFQKALDDGNDDLARRLLKVFETWSYGNPERFFKEIGCSNDYEIETLNTVLNKFGSDIKEYLSKFKIFDYSRSVDKYISPIIVYEYNSLSVRGDILKCLLSNINTFKETQFLKDEDILTLGFNYKSAQKRLSFKNRYGWTEATTNSIFIPIERVMKELFKNIENISETENYNLMEAIVEKFFAPFELDADTLADNVMSIYNDDVLKAYNSSGYYGRAFHAGTKTHTIESIKEVIDRAISAGTSIYNALIRFKPEVYSERKEVFLENITNTKGTLDLICAI